ncbi:MAG TPA: metallophosphoesterase [Porphyromonadaceae bacterium]|nr:metallophosphoesterase [Porphyromonadaceae bacterium]
MSVNRRTFIKQLSLSVVALSGTSWMQSCSSASKKPLRFGVISDVHIELQDDAVERLQVFIDEASKRDLDFIIQLGDLSHGKRAGEMVEVWNKYTGNGYHVLGNHDMDNTTKAEIIRIQQMPDTHYTFDAGGVRHIVLDCNFVRKDGTCVDYAYGNYYVNSNDRDLISDTQLDWLAKTLSETDKPVLIYSHQGLGSAGTPSRQAIRTILEKHNANKPDVPVMASLCGHHHIDKWEEINGIAYYYVNSASYLWVEGEPKYSKGNMAEYEDPLFAFVTLDVDKGAWDIEGVTSKFKQPAPQETETIKAAIASRQV